MNEIVLLSSFLSERLSSTKIFLCATGLVPTLTCCKIVLKYVCHVQFVKLFILQNV